NFLVNYNENIIPPTVGTVAEIKLETDLIFIFTKYNFSAPFVNTYTTIWIEVFGKIIRLGSVIYVGNESDETPIFAKVCEILCLNGKYIFCCQRILNFGLNRHFYAYSISLEH